MAPLITVLARHIWTPSSGSPVTLSTKLDQVDALDDPLWPRFVMSPIRGLRALPDMDDNREDNTERVGERPLKSFARGKTLTYSGRIYGSDWENLHAGADALLAALGPDIATGELRTGFMKIVPDLTGADQTIFGGQCRACEVVERIVIESAVEAPSPYWFEFTFDLRMEDGRFMEWDPVAEEPVADSYKW